MNFSINLKRFSTLSIVFEKYSVIPLLNIQRKVNVLSARDRDWEKTSTIDQRLVNVKDELSKADNNTTPFDWKTFSNKLITQELKIPRMHITESNVDGVIMRICYDLNMHKAGMSFFQYLTTIKKDIHDSILSKYLALLVTDVTYAKANEDLVMALVSKLRRSEILESSVAETCILAVCLYEKHWKEAFTLLEHLKIASVSGALGYNAIVEASFNFDDYEAGWKYLHHLADNIEAKPNPKCYLAILNYCERKFDKGQSSLSCLEDLFNFLNNYQIVLPHIKVVERLQRLIKKLSFYDKDYKWEMSMTSISSSGMCKSCKQFLDPVKISQTDMDLLSQELLKKGVIGKDIFIKSNPEELRNFKTFMDSVNHYDIVIDGLNVAYSKNIRKPDSQLHFVDKKWKVLVLGREHMKSWSARDMKFMYNNAKVFFARNSSQDDPFLLYAALKGGPNTYILSRDYMRPHMHILKDVKLKLLFKKWLFSHQYRLTYVTKDGRTLVEQPLCYLPCAQKLTSTDDDLCWHIPYDEEFTLLPANKMEPPNKWLCIRRLRRR